MSYLLLKWVHIVSSTILFGTGVGSAFYMFVANRGRDVPSVAFASRYVVLADWLFTTPAIIVQLLTGLALAHVAGYALTDFWILTSLMLYFFAGACWLPVVWMQIRMRDIAADCLANGTPLPDAYHRFARWWTILGCLAFPAVMVVFYLMVFKPN